MQKFEGEGAHRRRASTHRNGSATPHLGALERVQRLGHTESTPVGGVRGAGARIGVFFGPKFPGEVAWNFWGLQALCPGIFGHQKHSASPPRSAGTNGTSHRLTRSKEESSSPRKESQRRGAERGVAWDSQHTGRGQRETHSRTSTRARTRSSVGHERGAGGAAGGERGGSRAGGSGKANGRTIGACIHRFLN